MIEINKKQFLKLSNANKARVLKDIVIGKIKYKGDNNGKRN